MRKKYIFIKPFKCSHGIIPEGSEITIFRGFVYMNGGMIQPAYIQVIMGIINDPQLKEEYIKEEEIIHNKI
jgi:hypothetical protein